VTGIVDIDGKIVGYPFEDQSRSLPGAEIGPEAGTQRTWKIETGRHLRALAGADLRIGSFCADGCQGGGDAHLGDSVSRNLDDLRVAVARRRHWHSSPDYLVAGFLADRLECGE
jgi:hypothetical protein